MFVFLCSVKIWHHRESSRACHDVIQYWSILFFIAFVIPYKSTHKIKIFCWQLQSPAEDARECGCATVAGFVSEPGAIQQLMKHNVVKILAPLVLDSSPDVRLKALGALRWGNKAYLDLHWDLQQFIFYTVMKSVSRFGDCHGWVVRGDAFQSLGLSPLYMSHVMRLWYFLSSVLFKCACAANQWG